MRFAPKQATDDASARSGIDALHAALAGGVNTIHSSVDYGTQWALERALRAHPQRGEIQHIIKVQTPDYNDDHFEPADFVSTIDQALSALHTERIAIVQHLQRGPRISKDDVYSPAADPARIAAMAEVNLALLDTFSRLKAQGKVGALATFPHTIGFAEPAVESGVFSGVVHYFNLLENEIAPLLPQMAARDMGLIAIRPLLQGLLTNARMDRSRLAEGDKRRGDNWSAWYALLGDVRGALEAEGEDLSELTAYSLAFCLSHPCVTTLVTGINTAAQAEALLAALDRDRPSSAVIDTARRATRQRPEIPKSTVFG
jgi:aryl-alcohol dehydrogenase-like predicted oxidoreductase